MKKSDKNQNKSKKEQLQKSSAEIKLEVIEYIDKRLRDLTNDLREQFNKEINDHKQDLQRMIKRYAGLLILIISLIGIGGIIQAYRWSVAQVQKQISSRLDKEFKTENIRNLIEIKAKEYTEKKSQEYISKIITPFQEKITNAVDRANLEVEKFNDLFEIFIIAYNAQNGLKSAYVQLKDIAKQETEHGNLARTRLIEIQKRLQIYRYPPAMGYPMVAIIDGEKVPYTKLSIDEIVSRMENPAMPDEDRAMCMHDIKGKPRNEVFQKALEVFTTSESITTCAAFMGVLARISDNKAQFLDFDGWIKICREELKKM